MKKIKYFSFVGVIFAALLFLASCSKKALQTPVNLSVDINNKLSWDKVDSAKSYLIEIVGTEVTTEGNKDYSDQAQTRKTSYSLAKLNEGDYTLRVKAVDSSTNASSAWSAELSWHKDYENGAIYTLINNNTEYEVTRVGTAKGDIEIEDTYRGKPVTSIGTQAFRGSGNITSVKLGKYIKSIGDKAFYNCSNLVSVELPEGLESIGEGAFQSCRLLKSIVIPDSVTELNEWTFGYCRSLTSVTFSKNLKTIGESAFSDCSSLTSIVIPDTVETIGNTAFGQNTELTSVTLGSGLKSLGESAFEGCSKLETISFDKVTKLTKIGASTFRNCTVLNNVVLPNNLEVVGDTVFYGCTALDTITIPESVYEIGKQAFRASKLYLDQTAAESNEKGELFVYAGNWVVDYNSKRDEEITEIKYTTFNSDTVGIANQVFLNFSLITQVRLQKSIKYLGKYTFANCTILSSFVAQDGSELVRIGDYCFYKDQVLSNLKLKDGLEYIGQRAFAYCTQVNNKKDNEGNVDLTEPIIPTSVTHVGTWAFYNTGIWNDTTQISKDGGVIYAGKWVVGLSDTYDSDITLRTIDGISDYAFYKAENLKSIVGVNKAKYIGYGAFYCCSSLTSVTLSNKVTTIEPYTFYKCTSLFRVSIPDNLETIGEHAFFKCTTLTEIDLSDSSVTSIGDQAFYGCINVTDCTFSSELESIGEEAFYKCITLKEVNLPNTVTYIGAKAFYKDIAIEKITLSNTLEEINDYTFYGATSLKEIVIPDSVKTIGKSAFGKATAVEKVTLGKNLETIGAYAFMSMNLVKELNIPTSVKSIGSFAFRGWDSLTYILLSDSTTTLAEHSFYHEVNATIYTNLESQPDSWQALFNSSFRPVIWGCTLSEDKSYVVSVTITESTILNPKAKNGISAPKRSGYTFGGWKATVTNEDGTTSEVVYSASDIASVSVGTTLVAIWNQEA